MKIRGVCFVALLVVLMFPMLSGFAQVANKNKEGAARPKTAAKGSKLSAASVTANCATASQWQPDKMEENTWVSKAARDFASQLVSNYPSQLKNKTGGELTASDLTAGDIGLINFLVTAPDIRNEDQGVNKCTAATATADTNKQTGAPSGSDGTTSGTELTGIPELLSIAIENGSVTNNVSGNTMTLSTTLYGLMTGFGLIQDSSKAYKECYLCVRLGASGTFNVANTSSPLNSATRKAASQWQLKYSFFDQSTRSKRAKDLWEGTTSKDKNKETYSPKGAEAAAAELAAKAEPDTDSQTSETYNALRNAILDNMQNNLGDIIRCIKLIASDSASGSQSCVFASLTGETQPATDDGLGTLLLKSLDSDPDFQTALRSMMANPGTKKFAQEYEAALKNYQNAISQFEADVANLSKGWNIDATFGEQFPTTTAASSATTSTSGVHRTISVDGTTTSGTHLPDYLVGGVDLSWQPKTTTKPQGGGPASPNGAVTPAADGTLVPLSAKAPSAWAPSWTFNGKASFYTHPSTALNEKTFRGAQASTQFQWTLGPSPFVSDPNDKSKVTVALNGSYQRLSENRDQKGKRTDTTSGSFKLTIPFSKGMSIPLAVTYGNSQQQQAKGSYVIGNFGLSFDADKLAALLLPKH